MGVTEKPNSKSNYMKTLSIIENFKINTRASFFCYSLYLIGIIILVSGLADPASYSAALRKEKALKRYNEIAAGKTTNTLTESDYAAMQSAFDASQNADESSLPFTLFFGLAFVGAGFWVCRRN